MKTTYALASLVGGAFAVPQGVTDKIAPTGPSPAGCTQSFDSKFEITVVEPHANKRSLEQLEKRADCGANGVLVMSLKDGTTLDDQGRTGYIASNFQFQFDGPPQAGAMYTSGFSICDGNLLALGDSKVFYRCLSGNFYNLYNENWAPQCEPVNIVALPCGPGSDSSPPAKGNTVGTTMAQTTIVTALSDGQPQVITTQVPIPMCQIGDGQVQVHTTPCASVTSAPITDAPAPPPTNPVSQIPDGQIQVPPPAVTQIPDGQVQAPPPASTPVTQIPDGQVQAPPAASTPVTQIPDGQVQAPPAASTPVSQIPDGQIQAPSASTPVSQIPDGQIQAPTGHASAPTSAGGAGPSGTAPEDSAPSTAGSSQVTASVSALMIGAVFAFACL